MTDEARPAIEDYSDTELADELDEMADDPLQVSYPEVCIEAARRLRERNWPRSAWKART